jgi:hypothetical protein
VPPVGVDDVLPIRRIFVITAYAVGLSGCEALVGADFDSVRQRPPDASSAGGTANGGRGGASGSAGTGGRSASAYGGAGGESGSAGTGGDAAGTGGDSSGSGGAGGIDNDGSSGTNGASGTGGTGGGQGGPLSLTGRFFSSSVEGRSASGLELKGNFVWGPGSKR